MYLLSCVTNLDAKTPLENKSMLLPIPIIPMKVAIGVSMGIGIYDCTHESNINGTFIYLFINALQHKC